MNCRTLAEVTVAATADAAREDCPLTQAQADYAAALLAPYRRPPVAAVATQPEIPASPSSEAA